MKAAGTILVLFSIFIFTGGIMGQVKAASTLSLVMGTVFGVLLLLAGIGTLKNHLFPAYMGLVLTLLLDAFFTYRYLATLVFLPSGLLCLVSLVVLIVVASLIRSHLKHEQQ